MNIAVSNIAWRSGEAPDALGILHKSGVYSIEIAPSCIWPGWRGITHSSVQRERAALKLRGFDAPSLQALLFGLPQHQLFGTPGQRDQLLNQLRRCGEIASGFGARRLVLGAPKNRLRNGLGGDEAFEITVDALGLIADEYSREGLILCLEANPPAYGCDFLTTSDEVARVVDEVDSPGLRMHLDTACCSLAGEDPACAIRRHAQRIAHVHVSEPMLAPFDPGNASHKSVRAALDEIGYGGTIALEMRASESPLKTLEEVIPRFVEAYAQPCPV